MLPLQTNKLLPKLDARLAAAAAYVRPGSTAADVGCDHGLLSVHLAAKHICKKVIACDISEKPLRQAAQNLALHAPGENAECRLGNGLSVLRPGEAQDIILAGISGVTITQILAAAPDFWRADTRFIFVPSAKHAVLRRYLCENGFSLLGETPVQAAGRFYTVLCAQYTGCAETPTPLFCAVGFAANGTPAAQGYLKKEAGRIRKEAQGASGRQRAELEELARLVEQEAKRCQP